ncbi:hypothetical protein LLH06_10550 [Mucilaginibacter daejeonensis]|uniref:sigma factor-like helix-turn-helix DNA-binding protein n=1 Tax=Mucilaginibacter daejeonensis TaxID=398049 RepID=UPI001D1786AC|nr:sigma factor-like helix-turn-helix DNA-binding protein [Mucilaginibacter daejeonensis]UEG51412.1 hypothetical protein LLH06_10550 [Mucilaginibacter daejeonensis]
MRAKLINLNFRLYKIGDEAGFAYLYNTYYKIYFWQSMRMVKNNVVADSITQEAFLKLWLMRDNISDLNSVTSFLSDQTKSNSRSYYKKSSTQFHRSLLMLDEYPNYQDFLLGHNRESEDEDIFNEVDFEKFEIQHQQRLKQVFDVLPNLKYEQQLFIKLCLKYSFSYDRISYHLGGISDYEIAKMVEKSIVAIKSILVSTKKIERPVSLKTPIVFEGNLDAEQLEILNLRYELQYSFEQIAAALNLSQAHVQQQFLNAFASIKKSKTKINHKVRQSSTRQLQTYNLELRKAM